MVLGPDSEQPAIGVVAQKWRSRILFVIAEPLLRSETQRHGRGPAVRRNQVSRASRQDQAERGKNDDGRERSRE
jgi:hypothetical protein